MELYEQLGYTVETAYTLFESNKPKFSFLAAIDMDTAFNLVVLNDIVKKIDAGETLDTHFNLVQTRDNATFLKEAEKQKAIEYLQQAVQKIKNL